MRNERRVRMAILFCSFSETKIKGGVRELRKRSTNRWQAMRPLADNAIGNIERNSNVQSSPAQPLWSFSHVHMGF